MPYYFAYGSNMQSATLRGRRSVEYSRAIPGRALGWRLVLDKPSLLGVSGSYANLVEDPDATAYGVLFDVSDEDLEHIELTEGVLIDNYRRVIVPVVPLAAGDQEAISAFSLSSDRRGSVTQPTARYMSLLIEGAVEHGLPPEHIEFLRGIPVCEEPAESLQMRAAIDDFMRRQPK